MKEPSRTQLIEWHKVHENDVFDFAKEIHDYCKADVQFLKSGCIQFRNAFIPDTGIDPFHSCNIGGACMNVMRASHLKPNSIRSVPATVIAHSVTIQINPWSESRTAKNITGVSDRHAWSVGGEMYLKKAKAWVDAYYNSPRHGLHGMSFPWMSDVFCFVNNDYSFE